MQFLAKIVVVYAILFSTCLVKPETSREQIAPEATPIEEVEEKKIEKTEDDEGKKPTFKVVGVNDGDTITVLYVDGDEKKEQKIRLATIDAPEYYQPYGKKSRQNLSDLVWKKEVRIREMGRDRYGRIIGEVFVEGKNINAEQIRNGYAWHYKRHQKQQSFAEREIYSKAEKYARENKLGFWQMKYPKPPWVYRKQNPRNPKKEKRSEMLIEKDYE